MVKLQLNCCFESLRSKTKSPHILESLLQAKVMIFVILHKWREGITAGTLIMKRNASSFVDFSNVPFWKGGMIDAEAEEYFTLKSF